MPLHQHSFARAVTFCPNLYELNIALYGQAAAAQDAADSSAVLRMQKDAFSFDEVTLALLRSGPAITALGFSNWSSNPFALPQLLALWPSLQCLDIGGLTSPQAPCDSNVQVEIQSASPFTCALRELRTNFQTSPSIDFMRWLLHNSSQSLHVVEFARQPSAVVLEYLAAEHGSVLQSLSLPTCVHADGAAAIRKCGELKEFKTESAWVAPAVYKSLTDKLQHLAFGVDRDTSLAPMLQLIKRSAELEAVTVHLWDGGDAHPQLCSVKIACAMQGIDLRITRDIRRFRALTVSFCFVSLRPTLVDELVRCSEAIRCLQPRILGSSLLTISDTFVIEHPSSFTTPMLIVSCRVTVHSVSTFSSTKRHHDYPHPHLINHCDSLHLIQPCRLVLYKHFITIYPSRHLITFMFT